MEKQKITTTVSRNTPAGQLTGSIRRCSRSRLPAGLILLAGLGLGSGAALGEEIARWVDDQGVTHFGNTQFAPVDASLLKVKPANGMDVPLNVSSKPAVSGPTWTRIDKAPKQNKKGWRSKGEGPQNGPVSPSHR